MKKLLAVLLALALALTLALPAIAVDWDNFYVTKQPQGLIVPYGDSFTLSVEMNVPAGVKVSYQWLYGSLTIEGAAGPVLQISKDDLRYPKASHPYESATGYYYYVIIGTEEDAAGNAISSKTLRSGATTVTVMAERERNLWEKIGSFFSDYWLWDFLRNPVSSVAGVALLPFGFLIGIVGLIVVGPFILLWNLATGKL